MFNFGNTPVASTVNAAQQADVARQIRKLAKNPSEETQEIQIGAERYLAELVSLSPNSVPLVSLTLLKLFDKATLFLRDLNQVFIGLCLLRFLARSGYVFL